MGGAAALIFFGCFIMKGTAVLPAYAMIRGRFAREPFNARFILEVMLGLFLAFISGVVIVWASSMVLLAAYFTLTILASIVVPIVLIMRRIASAMDPLR